MDCSLPGSSVHGSSQARIQEWVAISSSKGFFWPRDWNCVSCIGRWVLYYWATWQIPRSKYFGSNIRPCCDYSALLLWYKKYPQIICKWIGMAISIKLCLQKQSELCQFSNSKVIQTHLRWNGLRWHVWTLGQYCWQHITVSCHFCFYFQHFSQATLFLC